MIAALASVIDSGDPAEIDRIIDGIVDPVGTFYRFSMARATLGRVSTEGPPETATEARS
jgi:F420-non-reducing hydrogenase small subunit